MSKEIEFFEVKGYPLMIFRDEGKERIWLAGCPHKRRPLSNSQVNGKVIRCPFHGAEFDLSSGRLVKPPDSKTPCPNDCSLVEVKLVNGEPLFSREPFVPSLPRKE
ncbi:MULTISPECIES: Rieske 2Fe-2S domain-containing protein [Metallosphaera]|uniref:Rieske (2Fe-2S) protein n=1 Tax=Metallosphaera TaxID=41980 RepID=UPI001F050A55|nr:Rieske 2Fe-2S domain-containing protein [Metallosphaera sedula]MCH1771151.1 Rieske 2Fe-2S domain-containing protein [Metallosphaera sedula]MCP6729523.1 Rieske 2Fe-2S domain-containing protein [Metallosphaera sedula]